LVQAELGAEAIVVSRREIPTGPIWNPWKKSAVEVVAAMPEDMMGAKKAPAISPTLQKEYVEERPEIEWEIPVTKKPVKLPPPLKMNLMPITDPSAPIAEPVRKIESTSPSNDRYAPPVLKMIQQQLIQQGVENSLVDNLTNLALETLSPATLGDLEACKKSIIQLMGAELRVQKGAGAFVSSNIVCVIGASGSGKTSVLAKLAMFFRENLNKSVTWVCADTVRMGAVAEAKAYTDALGLDLKLVYTPQDLKEIVRTAQANELFLVDTPGYNPCNERQMVELGALLAEMPGRCTYLVAPATAKETDLFQLYASLGAFNLNGLIATKLDETHNFGGLYNFVRKNQLPLSYFTTGRETSRHLEVADPARLTSALFGKAWNK
jgi:flagellar biosynthesis protein FlhF